MVVIKYGTLYDIQTTYLTMNVNGYLKKLILQI